MRNVILNMYMLLGQLKTNCVRVHGGFCVLCVQNLTQSEVWLCWLSPMSNVCLNKAVWNVCNVWLWVMTTTCSQPSHARADPRTGRAEHTSPALGYALTNPWLLLWVRVEVPVTGFLQKQPSHEPEGWVTGWCHLQKDTLDRQVQDLWTSSLPDK